MRAVGKYIFIKKSTAPEISESGFEFSEKETNDMRAHRATVLSVGHEVVGIEVGDDVYYDKARSFDQIIDGKLVTITREIDIMAILPCEEDEPSRAAIVPPC